jgi:hypothetical protein
MILGSEGLMDVAWPNNLQPTWYKKKRRRRCRGSNPGHPRDRREYSPLYYNDLVDEIMNILFLNHTSFATDVSSELFMSMFLFLRGRS